MSNIKLNKCTVPDEVEDESAAAVQFKAVFEERYCKINPGPNFLPEPFPDAIEAAFGGNCFEAGRRKGLGNILTNLFRGLLVQHNLYLRVEIILLGLKCLFVSFTIKNVLIHSTLPAPRAKHQYSYFLRAKAVQPHYQVSPR